MATGRKLAVIIEPDNSMAYVIAAVLKRNDFDVYTSQNVEKAIQFMKGKDVKIILISKRLNSERYDGTDVCRVLNKTYQGKIPIIITSRDPTESDVIKSIKAGALEFIVKPVSEQMLVKKIDVAMKRGNTSFIVEDNLKDLNFDPDMTLSEMIDVVINEADEIRAMPQAVAKINQVSGDDKSGAAAMEQAINSDPSIAAMVLKRANSAYYKGQSNIISTKQAVIRIGFNECRKMVMAFSVFNLFSKTDKNFGFSRLNFWLHSVATGIMAEMLAKKAKVDKTEDAFLAGLLHDFGKLLLDDYLSLHFQKSIQLANINNISLFESELNVFERTHNAVSKAVMEKWNFPEHIVAAVLRHHTIPKADPQKGIVPTINESLYLGNLMAKASLLGHGGDTISKTVSNGLWKAFGFEEDIFDEKFIGDYFEQVGKFLEFLGISEKEIGYQIKAPESKGTVLLLKDVEQDFRTLSFALQCQGFSVITVKEGGVVPDGLDLTYVVCYIKEREVATEMMKEANTKYPEAQIIYFSGNMRYKNELFSDVQLKVIEGPLDAQLLRLQFK